MNPILRQERSFQSIAVEERTLMLNAWMKYQESNRDFMPEVARVQRVLANTASSIPQRNKRPSYSL